MNPLKAFGHGIKVAFVDTGKVVAETGRIMVDIQPVVDVVLDAELPWAVPLYNSAVALIKKEEAHGAVTPTITPEQKAINVTKALEPLAIKFLEMAGVSTPTADQIKRYIDGAVMTLSAFEVIEGQ